MERLPTVLVLGGTTEATALVTGLAPQLDRRMNLIVSFAGRTGSPTAPAGAVRVGGFGGVDGLEAYLRAMPIDLVVDALHPFAAVMPFHAAEACRRTGVALLKLQRSPWSAAGGDRWIDVADMRSAAAAVQHHAPRRVLLTIGRQEIDAFRTITGPMFLVRSIEPADLHGPWTAVELLDRGPYLVDSERDLLRAEGIDLLVTKNSGGSSTAAKLTAAREKTIPVVMVRRPPMPATATVTTVADAIAWLDERAQLSG